MSIQIEIKDVMFTSQKKYLKDESNIEQKVPLRNENTRPYTFDQLQRLRSTMYLDYSYLRFYLF